MTLQLLVVCTANVCRSPMAGALLGSLCERHAVPVQVHTAGLQVPLLPVDPQAVTVMAAFGLDISGHRPQPVQRQHVDAAHLVLAMTREHVRHLATEFPGAFSRTFTVKEIARRVRTAPVPLDLTSLHEGRTPATLLGRSADDDIDDPYGMAPPAHARCADELSTALSSLAEALAAGVRLG